MMPGQAYITNLAAFLPGAPVGNDEIEPILGLVQGKPSRARAPVLRSNGIVSRHYAIDAATGQPTHSNAELAAEAIRGLVGASLTLDQIDCLACATSLPDQLMPNHGSMVHGALGIAPCEVMTASGVCLSGVTALKYAMMAVKSGEFSHAVAAASERASSAMRGRMFMRDSDASPEDVERRPMLAFEKDFLRFMLSDGAGAALIERQPAAEGLSLRIEWIFSRSYANETDPCMYAGAEKGADGRLTGWMDVAPDAWGTKSIFAVKQDAKQLNELVITYTVERALTELQASTGLSASEVTWFLPHYSSAYFRDRVGAGMEKVGFGIPKDRWFTNLTTRGNTGAASMYIMLEELMRSGRVQVGDRLLCFVPESGRFSAGYVLLTVCTAEGA
jgi:3-oxoacyl-[acyl-carrier-protein] synthase-3